MRTAAFVLVAAGLVTGCAGLQQASRERHAGRLSSPALCYVNYAGDSNDKAAASQELARRSFTCSRDDIVMGQQDFAREQTAQRASDQAARDAAMMYLMTRPAYTPPPAPTTQTYFINGKYVTCTTTGTMTTCN